VKQRKNNLKLWQARYILSVKILGSIVFAGTVGFLCYHLPVGVTPFILYPLWIIVTFILLWLYAVENAKWKMYEDWQEWVDNKLNSQEYTDALLFLHHRQMESSLDPTSPYYYDFKTKAELNYEAFLEEKFKDKPIIQEMYR
jgi:hypothetical protein